MCHTKTKSQSQVCNVDDDKQLLTIVSDRKRLFSHLNEDGRTVRFLLDCGATVNLSHMSVAQQINPGLMCLSPAESTLGMFDSTASQTAGMIEAAMQHPITGQQMTSDFYVAIKHIQAILGLKVCLKFELLSVVEENLCSTHLMDVMSSLLSRDSILQHYSDLFQGQGTLPGEIHLDINPTVPTVQMPLRRLPKTIHKLLRRELPRMINDGFIEPLSEPTPWISALLVVKKPSGKVRIDPKLLNKALKKSHNWMSTIKEVLPRLTNANVFCTVDAKNWFGI